MDANSLYHPCEPTRPPTTMSETCTLELECYPDDLSPIQLEQYEKAEKEHDEIRSKLNVGKCRAITMLVTLSVMFSFPFQLCVAATRRTSSRGISSLRTS